MAPRDATIETNQPVGRRIAAVARVDGGQKLEVLLSTSSQRLVVVAESIRYGDIRFQQISRELTEFDDDLPRLGTGDSGVRARPDTRSAQRRVSVGS